MVKKDGRIMTDRACLERIMRLLDELIEIARQGK